MKQQKQKASAMPEEDEEQTMAEEIFPSLLCFFLFDRRARFSASPDGRRPAAGGQKANSSFPSPGARNNNNFALSDFPYNNDLPE